MLRINVARSAAEMENFRSAWDSWWNPDLTLFQTFRWNITAARVFADREEPLVIMAENDSGAAIIPAAVHHESGRLHLLGETLFDYRDYLAVGDAEALVAAWNKLAELGLPIEATAVRRSDAAIWKDLPMHPYYGAPYLPAGSVTPEDFSATHARKGSRLRRLFRMGVELHSYCGRDERLVRYLYERRGSEGGPGNLFADERRREFMCRIAKEEGEKCEVFTFEQGSNTIAALLTFRDGSYRRFYTTYYDRAWARYSPGIELLFEITRRSLEEGLDVDFMTGEQTYKMRMATAVAPLYRIEASADQLRQVALSGRTGEKAA